MLKKGVTFWLAALTVIGAGACEKKSGTQATPSQTAAVGAAQADHAKAVADLAKADRAVESARQQQDIAKDRVEATQDRAKDVATNVADSNKVPEAELNANGPDRGWSHDWATFAIGTQATTSVGDYAIERTSDRAIVAWRKIQPVVGGTDAIASGAALASTVKSRLGQDVNDDLHGLDVVANEHVVTLRGAVKTADAAGAAVRVALGAPGADKVISFISWESR